MPSVPEAWSRIIRHLRLATGLTLGLVAAAFALPPLVAGRESGGLAAAATAALLFLAPMGIALGTAVGAAVYGWNSARRFGLPAPMIGFAPLGAVLLGLAVFAALAAGRISAGAT